MIKNKGFTLPEVTLSLAIFAVAAGLVGTVVIVSLNIFARNAELTRAKLLGDGAYEFISHRLTYGENITVTDELQSCTEDYTGLSPSLICVSRSGKISAGNSLFTDAIVPVFSESLYGTMTTEVDISYDEELPECIELTIRVLRENDDLYTRTRTVRMMNSGSDTIGFLSVTSYKLKSCNGDLYIVYTSI